MELISENFTWMILNVALAVLGAVFGLLFLKLKEKYLRLIFVTLWFLFLPNTIYMITDLQYLPNQLIRNPFNIQVILLGQYLVLALLGVVTYLIGMMPIEAILLSDKKKKDRTILNVAIVTFNFMMAFAVILGKIQRTNSWYVFTHPLRVLNDTLKTLNSEVLILWVIVFGVLLNLIYFGFKKRLPLFNIR